MVSSKEHTMARVIKVDAVVDVEDGQLRVWWSRNTEPLEYHVVDSPKEAIKIIDQLTQTDLSNHHVTVNACGLEEYEDGEWNEWYDNEQASITDLLDES